MNTQIDPLKIAIAKHFERDAIDELRTLVEASENGMSSGQIDSIERLAINAIEAFEITPDLIGVTSRVTKLLFYAANSERGMYISDSLLKLAEQHSYARSALILPLLHARAMCAMDASDNVSATEFLADSLRLAEDLEDHAFQVKFLSCLGAVLMQAGLYADGLKACERAIDLNTKYLNQGEKVLATRANMLYGNLMCGEHSAAISIINACPQPETTQSELETFSRIFYESNAAQVYAEVGLPINAKKHLAQARSFLEAYKTPRAEMAFEMAEGLVSVYAGDFKNGLFQMENALSKARMVGSAWHDYLPTLTKAYEYAGQPLEALRHTRALIDFRTAAQEKNIARYARQYQPLVDTSSGEPVIDEVPIILARLLTRAQILEGQVAKIDLMNAQQKLFLQRTEMLERMAVMAALRDDGSGERVYRVGRLASLLTHILGEDDHTVFMMEMAARLHDIGKISIPDSVVQKASVYAPAEHDLMKMHTVIGAELLAKSDITELQMAEQIARYHHEHWDGSGYPEGLKGEAIPLPARVVALADVFDALTHPRPYRDAFTIDAAIEEISQASGTQFEPRLVEPFIKLIQLLRHEQIADEHGNAPANLDDLLGQSAKASPLLLARQKIWASIDSVTEAKQTLLATPPQPTSSEKTTRLIETLTPTEREVFKWVQLGKTNPEIAQILGSKAPTIKTHVQRIYRKLGINTRVGLARLGVE